MMTSLQIERAIEAARRVERSLIELSLASAIGPVTQSTKLDSCNVHLEALAVCMERTVVEMEDA